MVPYKSISRLYLLNYSPINWQPRSENLPKSAKNNFKSKEKLYNAKCAIADIYDVHI